MITHRFPGFFHQATFWQNLRTALIVAIFFLIFLNFWQVVCLWFSSPRFCQFGFGHKAFGGSRKYAIDRLISQINFAIVDPFVQSRGSRICFLFCPGMVQSLHLLIKIHHFMVLNSIFCHFLLHSLNLIQIDILFDFFNLIFNELFLFLSSHAYFFFYLFWSVGDMGNYLVVIVSLLFRLLLKFWF